MKLTAAITLVMAAAASANPFRPASQRSPKSAYMNKLVKGAKATPGRKLEQEIDLTAYSLKFEQCQFVKAYDDDLADDQDSTTVLAIDGILVSRNRSTKLSRDCGYQDTNSEKEDSSEGHDKGSKGTY